MKKIRLLTISSLIFISLLIISISKVYSESCWVADMRNNRIVKLSADGAELLSINNIASPITIAANPADGSCWFTDVGKKEIVKISEDGQELVRLSGYNYPNSISINPEDGSCWIANTVYNQVCKISKDGKILLQLSGFKYPYSLTVNPNDGSCWVADMRNRAVVKLSSEGKELLRCNSFSYPAAVSVNPQDGSCWVADMQLNKVIKISENGDELFRISGYYPIALSANQIDGTCWVADRINNLVIKFSEEGNTILKAKDFTFPKSLSVNSLDGTCWVANSGNNQVVKLGADGKEIFRLNDFNSPYSVSVDPGRWPFTQTLEAVVYISPKTLNLKSSGKWITVHIELPKEFSVKDINISSLTIDKIDNEDIEPIFAELHPTCVKDFNCNGILDLMVKFDRRILQNQIAYNSDSLLIGITGELTGGTKFRGEGSIRAINGLCKMNTKNISKFMIKILKNTVNLAFNEKARVLCELNTSGFVDISIVNVRGEKIKRLKKYYQPAGPFDIEWNGTDDYGCKVASGLYIMSIKSDEENKIIKMLVLR